MSLRKVITGATWAEIACAAVALLLVILAAWWVLTEPGRARHETAEARANQHVASQGQKAASAATEIVSGAAASEGASNDLTQRNRDEILQAPGADDRVNSAVHDAGLRALCLRDAARDDPRCARLRKAGP